MCIDVEQQVHQHRQPQPPQQRQQHLQHQQPILSTRVTENMSINVNFQI